MSPEQRRRLRALSPAADDAMPLGGIARAMRIWGSLPVDMPEAERLNHVKSVLRMVAGKVPA